MVLAPNTNPGPMAPENGSKVQSGMHVEESSKTPVKKTPKWLGIPIFRGWSSRNTRNGNGSSSNMPGNLQPKGPKDPTATIIHQSEPPENALEIMYNDPPTLPDVPNNGPDTKSKASLLPTVVEEEHGQDRELEQRQEMQQERQVEENFGQDNNHQVEPQHEELQDHQRQQQDRQHQGEQYLELQQEHQDQEDQNQENDVTPVNTDENPNGKSPSGEGTANLSIMATATNSGNSTNQNNPSPKRFERVRQRVAQGFRAEKAKLKRFLR